MFKLIVTLKNGGHKVMRMSRQMVAHIVHLYEKMMKDIFSKKFSVEVGGELLILNDCARLKFLDESTRTEFLTLG